MTAKEFIIATDKIDETYKEDLENKSLHDFVRFSDNGDSFSYLTDEQLPASVEEELRKLCKKQKSST